MWEAVAAPGQMDALVAWAVAHTSQAAQVYRSADDRVVIIDSSGDVLPDPPKTLVARSPHAWDFEAVRR
jgi:hypothetical protein